VRRLVGLIVVVLALFACGAPSGGGASGGGTTAPKTSAAPSAMPSGNPNVDNYGY